MKIILAVGLILVTSFQLFAQEKAYANYYNAFNEINKMLETSMVDFKRAVFLTENAYFDNKLEYSEFKKDIELLKILSEQLIKSRELIYTDDDKPKIEKYAAIFTVMTDTLPIQIDSSKIVYHLPFQYDFEDAFGKIEWSSMFITKLLKTRKGNCHSLPVLYRILADELNVETYLSLAPNHLYIKQFSKKGGWYNTELTSAAFPIDAWLMVSGYISLTAIQNGIYLDTLSNQQTLSLCLLDLAKGFDRKFKSQHPEFVIMCCDTALKYYPNFVNAMLLKAETKKKELEYIMKENDKTNFEDVLTIPKAKNLFDEINILYADVHKLGYREMPEKMYFDWLLMLHNEREKYTNKKILPTFNK